MTIADSVFTQEDFAPDAVERVQAMRDSRTLEEMRDAFGADGLGTRAYHALRRGGFTVLGEVARTPDEELLRVPWLGRRSLARIRAAVPSEPDLCPCGRHLGSVSVEGIMVQDESMGAWRQVPGPVSYCCTAGHYHDGHGNYTGGAPLEAVS